MYPSIFVTVVLLFAVLKIEAQKAVVLRPALGMHIPFSHVVDRTLAESSFSSYWSIAPQFAIDVQYSWNPKNSLSIGYQASALDVGYQYATPQQGFVTKTLSSRYLMVFPIGYSRYLFDGHWFPIKAKSSDYYVINFSFNLNFGLSYCYLPLTTGDNILQTRSFGDSQVREQILSRDNLAIFFGFIVQFQRKSRNTIQLSFVYSKGFVRQLEQSVDYRVDSPNYDYRAVTGSRGSYAALQIGYPICIWPRK